MNADEWFECVTMIGAAGKMGRGISLLLAQEMARVRARPENRGRAYRLTLIDTRQEGLQDVLTYLEVQLASQARQHDAPERSDALSIIHVTTDTRDARGSRLVFEAVPEVESLKIEILRRLREVCPDDAFFLSNTSSVPIHVLDRGAGLDGRIIGFHFYNPPVIQKLLELIAASTTREDLAKLAWEIGGRLGKKVVPSRDVAGFIGNGYFVRDTLHAIHEAERLRSRFDEAGAIHALNRVSQEGLLRPMGIFQLLDYVGIDVFSSILTVMTRYLEGEAFHADVIDRMVSKGVLGGQCTDGTQKDGFFRYDGRRPIGVFDPERKDYISLENCAEVDRTLGLSPGVTWRSAAKDPDSARKIGDHFARLASEDTLGGRLAIAYLAASRRIGEKLVSDGIARSREDVNEVLTGGFHHLYGPFNPYVPNGQHDQPPGRKPSQ